MPPNNWLVCVCCCPINLQVSFLSLWNLEKLEWSVGVAGTSTKSDVTFIFALLFRLSTLVDWSSSSVECFCDFTSFILRTGFWTDCERMKVIESGTLVTYVWQICWKLLHRFFDAAPSKLNLVVCCMSTKFLLSFSLTGGLFIGMFYFVGFRRFDSQKF